MIVFILRHGQRKPDAEDALTPAGVDRANLLTRMLNDCGVTVAFAAIASARGRC